jgi:hypothetical protein
VPLINLARHGFTLEAKIQDGVPENGHTAKSATFMPSQQYTPGNYKGRLNSRDPSQVGYALNVSQDEDSPMRQLKPHSARR